jgi:glutathione S-transferase
MTPPLRLVTIPFSHYCEKARWVLEHAGLEYDERRFLPIFHMMGTLPLGGRSVPVLTAGKQRLTDSTDIALFVDSLVSRDASIYPTEPDLRRESLNLEELYDTRLGPHVRRWLYFHLLSDRALAIEFMRTFGKGLELELFTRGFPVFSRMMRQAMNIDAVSAARSLGHVEQVFLDVSERLSDGRPFLTGDRFSIADVTFAALGAAAVFPDNYGGPTVPRIERVPSSIADVVSSFRSTKAGQFILRLYDEHRMPRGDAAAVIEHR